MVGRGSRLQLYVKRGATVAAFDKDCLLSGTQAAKSVIGTFIEVLAATMVGAVPWPARTAFKVPDVSYAFTEEPYELEPDMVVRENATLIEAKAAVMSYYLHVHVDQFQAYEWIRRRATRPAYRPRVAYALFGYRLPKKCGKYRTAHELLRDLVNGIEVGAVLDADVIGWMGAKYGQTRGYWTPLSHQYGGWNPVFKITPSRVLPFALDPAAALAETGLGGRWTTRRLDSGAGAGGQLTLPIGTVAGPLRPFPAAVVVKDRGPRRGVDMDRIVDDPRSYADFGYIDRVGEGPLDADQIPF